MNRRHWLALAFTTTAAVAGPAAQVDAPAVSPRITEVLAHLDARFARGDVQGYLAAFRPDHPGAHALLQRQLQQLLALEPRPRLRSAVLTPPRQIGDRTVVRVRRELSSPAWPRPVQQDAMLALRAGAGGALEPTLLVEIPTQWGCVRDDRFRCPPCNYEIGGVDGWLCVPLRPERAAALEAVTFYLLGTDLACDVSVCVDTSAPTAAAVVRELGAALASVEPGAQVGPVETWTPPAHAADRPPPLAAAQLAMALPRDFDGRGGSARLFVVTFGGLQHLLLLRGSAATLRARARDVEALLASYRLLQLDLDLALAAAEPLQHHTGGSLAGACYLNTRFGFRLAGPDGWRAEQRSGGAALRVVWTSPAGSRLWLTGYELPPDTGAWTPATADRWLQQLLARADLVVRDDGDGDWTEPAGCRVRVRTLVCAPRAAASPGSPRARTIRALLRDDVLLVADAQALLADDAAARDRAIGALQQG